MILQNKQVYGKVKTRFQTLSIKSFLIRIANDF